MRLARLLSEEGERVIEHWLELVRRQIDYGEATRPQLVNEVPQLLHEIRRRIDPSIKGSHANFVARRHGVQRRWLGMDATNLMREFGLVQHAVLDVARERGVRWEEEDYRALISAVNDARVSSVEAYGELRDEEMQQQTARSYAFVAHELRSPLQSALLAAEVISARPDQAEQKIPIVLRNLRRLRDLIDSTMTESRLRQKIQAKPEELDATGLLREIVRDAAPTAAGRGVEIDADLPSKIPVRWDRHLMRSALANLVDNAVKFSTEGSTIQIRALAQDPHHVQIDVEDRCGGLPPGFIDRLFEPFVRGESREGGFGLGLRIARQAVEAHGGDLSVKDFPGTGCVFSAVAPREVEPESEAEPQS